MPKVFLSDLGRLEASVRACSFVLGLLTCRAKAPLQDCGYPAHALMEIFTVLALVPAICCAIAWPQKLKSRGADRFEVYFAAMAAVCRLVFGMAAECVTFTDDFPLHTHASAIHKVASTIFFAFLVFKMHPNKAGKVSLAVFVAGLAMQVHFQALARLGYSYFFFRICTLASTAAECALIYIYSSDLRDYIVDATVSGKLPLYESKHS